MDRYGPSTQRRQPAPAPAASLAPRGPPRSLRKTWSPERTANAGHVALGQSHGQLKPAHEMTAAIEHWEYDGPGGDLTARDEMPTGRSYHQTHAEPEAASGKDRRLPSGHALVDLAAMDASDEAVIHGDSGDAETVEETIAHEDTEARRRHRADSRFERAGSLAGSAVTHTRSLSSLDSRMFGRISRTTVARSHFMLRRHVLGAPPEQRTRGLGDAQQQGDRGDATTSSQQVPSPQAGQPRNSSGVAGSCSPERSAHGLSTFRLPVPGLVATPVPLLSRLHPSPLALLPAVPAPSAALPAAQLPLRSDHASRSLPKASGLVTSPSAPSLGDSPAAALPPWDWPDTLSPPPSGGLAAVAALTPASEVVPAASPPPQAAAAAAAHAQSPQASPGGARPGRGAPGAPKAGPPVAPPPQQQQHLRPRRHPPVAEVTVLSQQAQAAAQQSRGGRGLWGGRSASDA